MPHQPTRPTLPPGAVSINTGTFQAVGSFAGDITGLDPVALSDMMIGAANELASIIVHPDEDDDTDPKLVAFYTRKFEEGLAARDGSAA